MNAIRSATACAVLVLIVLVTACSGGGGGRGSAPDLKRIPTATLPAQLPEPTVLGAAAAVSGGATTYVVRDGDSLSVIAERLGVSVQALRDANPDIASTGLIAGQRIRVPRNGSPASEPPTPAPTEAPPTAAATKAPPTEAPATALAATPTEAPPAETATVPAGARTYVVQAGDIPVTIAEKFGITVEALLAANPGIDPRGLQVGQVLIIPAP